MSNTYRQRRAQNTVIPTVAADPTDAKYSRSIAEAMKAVESLDPSHSSERFRKVWQELRRVYENRIEDSKSRQPFPLWALSQFALEDLEPKVRKNNNEESVAKESSNEDGSDEDGSDEDGSDAESSHNPAVTWEEDDSFVLRSGLKKQEGYDKDVIIELLGFGKLAVNQEGASKSLPMASQTQKAPQNVPDHDSLELDIGKVNRRSLAKGDDVDHSDLDVDLHEDESDSDNGLIKPNKLPSKSSIEWRTATRRPIKVSQNAAIMIGNDYIDEDAMKARQKTQKDFIALPPPNSGYPTSAAETKIVMSTQHTGITQSAQETEDEDISDTDYSSESSGTFSKKHDIIRELANELFKTISSLDADQMTQQRLSTTLPKLLQAFALKVGYGAKTNFQREFMAFVHRYRHMIAKKLFYRDFEKDLDHYNHEKRKAKGMSWQDRTSLWFEKTSFEESPEEPARSSIEDGEALEENLLDQDEESPESWLNAWPKFLASSSAYEEFLARFQREFYLVPAKQNIMGQIREWIMSSLPSPRKVSRKSSPRSSHAIFQLDWDIVNFFSTQAYSKEPYEAFEGVITITGSCVDAQAATCSQYIKQTWPITGETVILLIKNVLQGVDHVHQLPDGTKITAWIDTPKFMLEVFGVSVSVAEIGGLVSWLGAALRTSPRPNGLIYCVPKVRRIVRNPGPLKLSPSPLHSTYEIDFSMETVRQTLPTANGQCWHDIFRNPVVVRGYPIPRRSEWNTGLEISLNIMAGLARTQRLNQFKQKIYIKGFSTMLVPTRKTKDTICWHLIYNKNGSRISYLDNDKDQEQSIEQLDLDNYRHVMGWCSEAKLYAGSAEARHPVAHSGLPKPHAGCPLAGVSVSEGKMILNGPAFNIGARDTPVYISRKGNIRRLKWISTKFILLWDERDKRGWLINGATALLHIVRAFLSHAKQDHFKHVFQFKDEDLEEAEAPFMAESAIAVLLNPHNRRLKLYEEENGDNGDNGDNEDEYLFKTQIDHVYNLLEKLIDHQADVSRHYGSKLSNNPRRYLEGWEFEDVVKECPTIYPRVATIADAGKGWVDFVRDIHAVTLVGRGFGDIIKPADRDQCESWATLPTKRYYIASCVSDLDRLLKEAGSHQDGHDLLCDNLIYHAPASVYLSCQCRVTPRETHCEPVRTVVPTAMSTDLPLSEHRVQYDKLGAAILGYNSHFPLMWGDNTGSPKLGKLLEMEPLSKVVEQNVDSGFGSNSTESGPGSHSVSRSESEIEYLAMSREIHHETARKVVPYLATTVDNNKYTRNDYTVGIICPLAKELKAVRTLFDNEHDGLNPRSEDSYPYVLGDMAGHWIVAACLPEYGTNSAATVASDMKFNFPSIRFCLLVGIAGGVPLKEKGVRLGDVVVSYPTGTSPGVIQYDLGKEEDGNHFQRTGSLQRPPLILMAAINTLQSDPKPPDRQLDQSPRAVTDRLPEYKYPGQDLDVPYQTACASCTSHRASLVSCSHIKQRVTRTTTLPTIHYGVVASGNRVIKDATLRNQLAQEHGILCFEMEAAGVMNTLNCLVIRGISDYCDGQKNDSWQNYAAATAAAYAKLLLKIVPKGKRSGAGSTERYESMSLTKKRRLD